MKRSQYHFTTTHENTMAKKPKSKKSLHYLTLLLCIVMGMFEWSFLLLNIYVTYTHTNQLYWCAAFAAFDSDSDFTILMHTTMRDVWDLSYRGKQAIHHSKMCRVCWTRSMPPLFWQFSYPSSSTSKPRQYCILPFLLLLESLWHIFLRNNCYIITHQHVWAHFWCQSYRRFFETRLWDRSMGKLWEWS